MKQLADLLEEAFSKKQLRTFLMQHYRPVGVEINWDQDLAAAAADSAEELTRQRYVDAVLFQRLTAERPNWASEVAEVASSLLPVEDDGGGGGADPLDGGADGPDGERGTSDGPSGGADPGNGDGGAGDGTGNDDPPPFDPWKLVGSAFTGVVIVGFVGFVGYQLVADWLTPHCWQNRGFPETQRIRRGSDFLLDGGDDGASVVVDNTRGLRAVTVDSTTPDPMEHSRELVFDAPIVFSSRPDAAGFCHVYRLPPPNPGRPYPPGAPDYRHLGEDCLQSALDQPACGGGALAGPVVFVAPPGTAVKLSRE